MKLTPSIDNYLIHKTRELWGDYKTIKHYWSSKLHQPIFGYSWENSDFWNMTKDLYCFDQLYYCGAGARRWRYSWIQKEYKDFGNISLNGFLENLKQDQCVMGHKSLRNVRCCDKYLEPISYPYCVYIVILCRKIRQPLKKRTA